jgi:meiotic recombination protein REC8
MPWNILSSRAGSARPPGVGRTSSTGALAGGGFEPARRLTSASPLFGRGKQGQGTTRYSSLEIPGPAHTSGELGTFDDEGFQLPDIEDEDFELHGPAARVSTQQADNSQWLANTLEDEANNFFAFLQAEIQQRKGGELEDDAGHGYVDEKGVVTFEELLPPDRNSAVVAAQGLLHVLTLVTRGAVMVVQEENFGKINMEIVPGVRLVERERTEEEIEVIDLDDLAGGEGVPENVNAEDVEDDVEGDKDMYG